MGVEGRSPPRTEPATPSLLLSLPWGSNHSHQLQSKQQPPVEPTLSSHSFGKLDFLSLHILEWRHKEAVLSTQGVKKNLNLSTQSVDDLPGVELG